MMFVAHIGLLYMIEAENIKFHRSADEIRLRRSKAEVTAILPSLYAKAEKMLKNRKRLHYGDSMNKALHSMLNGGSELQNYRTDGRYTIDNMIAERVIRTFTVNRNSQDAWS